MFTKDALNIKKKIEILAIARSLNIKGRSLLTKDKLVLKILDVCQKTDKVIDEKDSLNLQKKLIKKSSPKIINLKKVFRRGGKT
jgi:hypothetical protein